MDEQAAGPIANDLARRSHRGVSVQPAGSRGLSNAKVDPLACADINPRIRLLSGARVPGNGLTAGFFKTENNHSITIRIEYGTSSFLWTGDMQTEALKLLVDRYSTNGMLDAQVYEAGHHGAPKTEPLKNLLMR